MRPISRSAAAALILAAGFAASSAADPMHQNAPAASGADAALAELRALEGTWTGKAGEGDVTVTYHTTGAGSAVVETIMPGTPHEMVSVYHRDGDRLVMTHYCAAGNQPTMTTDRAPGGKTIQFTFDHGTNMKPTDEHMHAVRFTFVDADHLEAEWTHWKDGKAGGSTKFVVARKR